MAGMDERIREALDAVRRADARVEAARQAQQAEADARARAIADLVAAAGRQEAARLLGIRLNKVDQATARVRALGRAGT